MKHRIILTLISLYLHVVACQSQCDTLQLLISTQSQLDSFKRLYPECRVLKRLEINGDGIDNIEGINVLDSIGTLLIRRTNIEVLNLDFLKAVNILEIDNNNNLSKFHKLSVSNELSLKIRNNFNLTEIDSIKANNCDVFHVANSEKLQVISNIELVSSKRINLANIGNNLVIHNMNIKHLSIFEILNNKDFSIHNSNIIVSEIQILNNRFENLPFLNSIIISDKLLVVYNEILTNCNTNYVCSLLLERPEIVDILANGPGCKNKQEVLENCTLSDRQIQKPQNLGIIPNPTKDEFKFYTNAAYDDIWMYNQVGQRISVSTTGDRIDVSYLPTGIYYLYLSKNGIKVTETQKLVKIE